VALERAICRQDAGATFTLQYSFFVDDGIDPADLRAGLCARCSFMKKITSAKGSVFYQCGRSATDPRFPKYPRLPVLRCRGFEEKSRE
jgi:hypothetical protein